MTRPNDQLDPDVRAVIAIRAWKRETRIARNPTSDPTGVYILDDLRDARAYLSAIENRTPIQERLHNEIERIFKSFR